MKDVTEEMDTNLSQMLAAAQSLQASHELTAELERSKANIELLIDGLPTLFAVINDNGEIYKANHALSMYFGVHLERMIGHSLSTIFKPESWKIFQAKKSQLTDYDNRTRAIEFELSIDAKVRKPVEMLWSLRPFGGLSGRHSKLYQVLAQDISMVKRYERKLTQVFTAIPLGIFTVGEELLIKGPWSQYAEHLLGTADLNCYKLRDVLFSRAKPPLSALEKQHTEALNHCIGKKVHNFEVLRDELPGEIQIAVGDDDGLMRLGITYHPIVQEGHLEEILIVLENRNHMRSATTKTKSKKAPK